jgi:hypothetical protein
MWSRAEVEAVIRKALVGLGVEDVDALMAGVEALPFDEQFVQASVVAITAHLARRATAMQAECVALKAQADEADQRHALFMRQWAAFQSLVVANTIH